MIFINGSDVSDACSLPLNNNDTIVFKKRTRCSTEISGTIHITCLSRESSLASSLNNSLETNQTEIEKTAKQLGYRNKLLLTDYSSSGDNQSVVTVKLKSENLKNKINTQLEESAKPRSTFNSMLLNSSHTVNQDYPLNSEKTNSSQIKKFENKLKSDESETLIKLKASNSNMDLTKTESDNPLTSTAQTEDSESTLDSESTSTLQKNQAKFEYMVESKK